MAKKQNKEDNRLLLGSVRMPDVSNPSRDEVFKRRSAVSDDWEPSKELLDAIKSYEKFSPVVYKDGNGIETIGYGITDKKIIAKYRGGKRMSKREAERLFNRHVDDVIAQMKGSIPNFDAMSNNQKDAMTSYVYNVGIGGVTRKSPKLMEALENKNWKEAAKQMDFGYNDKNNSGLRRRRDEERALFTAYLDMGLEEPTEEELAAAHARMQQNALEDILSSRNELELQDPLRTKFDEAYRVATERKQPTFTWNGREFATDLKQNGGPTSKEEEQAIIDHVNQSKADFIQRLLNGNPMSIPDWEKKGNISTHKLRAEIDENGNAIVFPIVQNIDGKLYDFSDPANGRSLDNEDYVWKAMDSAINRGDTVRFNNIGEAIWFADNNYKKFYDSFQKPDGGPVIKAPYIASRDATSVGQLAPNPNARDVTGIFQPVDLTEIVAGGIPVVGDVMDARDLYTSIRDRDAIGALFASVGFLPIVGGAAKSALRMRYSPDVLRKRVTYGFDTPEEAARMMGVAEDELGNTINLLSENIDNLPDNVSEETVANIRGQVERFKEWAKESNIPAIRESDKAFNLSRPFDPKHPIENQKVFDSDYGRIKKFADKYGYEIPNKSDIKSDLELDDLYQRLIRQHRTFVRGVRANNEHEAMQYLFELAPETGAGRYGLDSKMDVNTKSNYVSNSIDQALGYATGYGYNGENGWIGFMRIGKPLDFTKSLNRKDWLDQAEFDYDIRSFDVFQDIREKRIRNIDYNEYKDRIIDFISQRRKPTENSRMPDLNELESNLDLLLHDKIPEKSNIKYGYQLREEKENVARLLSEKYGIRINKDDMILANKKYENYIKNFYKKLSEKGFKTGDITPAPMDPSEYYITGRKIFNSLNRHAEKGLLNIMSENGYIRGITHGGGYPESGLTHYIITNKGLIQPISYQNIGNVDPDNYTRRHFGEGSSGLSRKEFEEGGSAQYDRPVTPRDAIQPPANPTMDFMNLIGESIPYDAGELPGVTVTAERTYDGGTLPEVIVEAINKRRREHELPELTMDVYFDAVANIVREENKRRKNISLPELTMDDYIASLDNIRIGSEKPNPNKKGEVKINPGQYTSIINGLIPVWGDIQDAADFFEAMQNDDSMGQIIALTGLIPFIGGGIKATIGNMAKGVAVNYAQENRKPDGGYIAPRDATTVGALEPNPNAPDITNPSSGVDISEIVAGGIPVVGDVMDVRDFLRSAKDRDAVGMFLSGIGLIPVFGGFGKQMLNARRIPNNLTPRDKELLDAMPEYANPNSPAGEAWLNHKKRLISGAYKRLVGEDLILHNGEIDPSQLDTKVYDALDPAIIEEAKRLEMTDYTEDEIKEILENEEGYFIVGSKIAKGKMEDIPKEELFGQMKDMTDEEIEDMMKSHEIEHLVHYPDKAPSKDAFSIDRIIEKEDLTDDQKKELRRYFKQASGTELSARGTQIKDYFGLTDDSQEVTPEMLEYASRHYIEDYGDDNMMSLFFDGIVDYKKMAKWITDHASVGLGVYFLNEAGQRVTQDELKEKKQGGFIYHSQKPHKGDPEISDVLRYRSHKFYIYGGKMNKNDKKQNGGSVSPTTTFNLESRELPTVEHIMDVVSEANRESMDPVTDSITQMGYVPYIRNYFQDGGGNSDGILTDYFKKWNEWVKRPKVTKRKDSMENASELTKIQSYYKREVVPSLKKKMARGGYTDSEIKKLQEIFAPSGETPGADNLDALMGTIQDFRYNIFNATRNDIRSDGNVRSVMDMTIRYTPPEDFLTLLRNTNGFGADYARRIDRMPESIEKDDEIYKMRDAMADAVSYAPVGLGAAYYNSTTDDEVVRQMGGLVQHWGDRDWGPDEEEKTPEQIKAELDERYKITPDMPEADRLMMLNLRSFQEGGDLSNEYKVKYLYDLLLNEAGMSQTQALAVLGNLWGESQWHENASGDTNTSYGIQQWHGERRKKLIEFAKQRSGNEDPTFWDQAHFLVKEYKEGQGFLDDNDPVKLDGYLSYSKNDFQNAESLHDAVVAWNQGFGRPHKKVMRTEDRYKGALKAAEMLGITVDENMPSYYGINGINEDPIVPAFDSFAVTATKPSGAPTATTSVAQNTGEEEDIPTVPGIENMTREERQKLWFETYGKQMVEDYIAEENRVRKEQEDARRLQYQQQAEAQAKRDAEAAEQARRQAIIEQALDEAMLNIPGMARGK